MLGSKIKIIEGDLIKSSAKYIGHQTNCTTTTAKGLAFHLFKKFPYSDVYSSNTNRQPGKIIVRGNGKDQRWIVNMCAQLGPGKPNNSNDSAELRMQWFVECLKQIEGIQDLHSIAFPYQIGCGLAGGNWEKYLQELQNFASRVQADVYIYKLQ